LTTRHYEFVNAEAAIIAVGDFSEVCAGAAPVVSGLCRIDLPQSRQYADA
jgi:hypothetical protein